MKLLNKIKKKFKRIQKDKCVIFIQWTDGSLDIRISPEDFPVEWVLDILNSSMRTIVEEETKAGNLVSVKEEVTYIS